MNPSLIAHGRPRRSGPDHRTRLGATTRCLLMLGLTARLGAGYSADAATATLAWEPVTTNADGTPVTDTTCYRIYCGASSRTYTSHTDAGTLTTGTVKNLRTDTLYYFAVTALDPLGGESEYSEEVWWRAPVAPASMPTWGSVDSDADAMPDAWETQYFPDAQVQSIDPAVDADGDDRSNLDEFIAGTDPSIADAAPSLEIVRSSEGLPTITFQTLQAVGTGYSPRTRFYALESCIDLDEGLWTAPPDLGAIEASKDPIVFYAGPSFASETRFWRVRVWLQ